jgi:hypothetical protein
MTLRFLERAVFPFGQLITLSDNDVRKPFFVTFLIQCVLVIGLPLWLVGMAMDHDSFSAILGDLSRLPRLAVVVFWIGMPLTTCVNVWVLARIYRFVKRRFLPGLFLTRNIDTPIKVQNISFTTAVAKVRQIESSWALHCLQMPCR